MGLKNNILRGSKDDPVNGWGQNIPVDDRYQIRDVWESVFEKPIPHTFVQIAQLRQSEAIHTGEDLVQPKFEKVKGKFHQPLGIKNTILIWMTDTRSGLYEKALLKAQSHTCSCKSPNSDWKGLANVTESRGSNNLWDLKKHHITRNWGDPVNSQGDNIPLVTDTG